MKTGRGGQLEEGREIAQSKERKEKKKGHWLGTRPANNLQILEVLKEEEIKKIGGENGREPQREMRRLQSNISQWIL